MKMRNCLFLLSIFFCFSSFGQVTGEKPEIIGCKYINDIYEISWFKVDNADKYKIYKFTNNYISTFPKVIPDYGAPVDSAFFQDPLESIYRCYIKDTNHFFFVVKAFKGNTPITNDEEFNYNLPWNNAPSNIVLKDSFYQCSYKDTLKWSKLYYKKKKYNYKIYIDSKEFKTVTDTFFPLTSALVEKYRNSKFQIIVSDLRENYSSNIIGLSIPSDLPNLPSHVKGAGSYFFEERESWTEDEIDKILLNQNQLKINFEVDPTSKLEYKLYRDNELIPNASLPIGEDGTISTIDIMSDFNTTVHDYRLKPQNVCGQALEGYNNLVSNLRLTSQKENTSIILNFNRYNGFSENTEYTLKRITNKGIKIFTNVNPDWGVPDNFDSIPSGGSRVCYYLIAKDRNGTGRAVSNLTCESFSSLDKVAKYMSKYLILGKSCTKSSKPFGLPSIFKDEVNGFQMIIFDRWGTMVFESTDRNTKWDGTTLNGSIAPEGGYVYYIKFSIDNDEPTEIKGNLVVLCP